MNSGCGKAPACPVCPRLSVGDEASKSFPPGNTVMRLPGETCAPRRLNYVTGESGTAGDLADAFDEPCDLLRRRVAGAAGAHQPLFAEAEPLDDGRRVEVAVRDEDA